MLVESALTVLLAGVKVSALFPPAVTALVVVAALVTDNLTCRLPLKGSRYEFWI